VTLDTLRTNVGFKPKLIRSIQCWIELT